MKAQVTILPTIHLNGTSAQTLTEGYSEARIAVQAAMDKLQKVEFNARDYYPQGQLAWLNAVSQRQELLNKLSTVQHELFNIEIHCSNFTKD